MIPALIIGLAFVLLGGFLFVLALENTRGGRFFESLRAKLDARVSRGVFIATHVDWGALMRYLAETAYERVLHDTAQGILRLVRATERALTRTVRRIRERRGFRDPEEAGEESRASWIAPFQRLVRTVRTAARKRARRPRKTESED